MKHVLFILGAFVMTGIFPHFIEAKGTSEPTPYAASKNKKIGGGGLKLSFGACYTNELNYGKQKTGGTSEAVTNSAHLGGVFLGVNYFINKHFGLCASLQTAFTSPFTHTVTAYFRTADESRKDSSSITMRAQSVYAVDTQLGLFYAFAPARRLTLKTGGGLALGGAGLSKNGRLSAVTTKDRYGAFLAGAFIFFDASYSFTRTFSLYATVQDNLYGVVLLNVERKSVYGEEKKTAKGAASLFECGAGSFMNGFSLRLGFEFTL